MYVEKIYLFLYYSMSYQWRVSPTIIDAELATTLKLPPAIVQLLANRGLISRQEIEVFLENKDEPHDPFLFKDMELACQLIIERIKRGELIAIAGDYDADGVTASAILVEILSALKAKTRVWIPSRQ